MSNTCRVNPLEQLGSKSRPPFNNQNCANILNQSTNNNPVFQHESKESIFFNQGQQKSFAQHESFPMQSPILPTLSRTHTITDEDSLSDEWLTQFSSMKVYDPLEFTNDYKTWYDKYVSGKTTSAGTRMQNSQMNRFANIGNQRPLLTRNYQSGYIPVKRAQTAMFQRTMTTPLSAPATAEQSIDSYFDLEFTNLENELHNQQIKNDSNTEISTNFEQIEFQKAATDIVKTCSLEIVSSPNETSRSQLQSKFASSKFIGLMRKVSDGVVTLKDTKKELYTPKTGEVVGNEYFPILDEGQEEL
ncbi:Pex21p PWA37_003936 [Arxiozyma heterogenica]|uniref:PEX18/PEX21 C-terminal domain-containing protein n=1 Tax=Arxiozyma heterogenica TaxID=278026 RepID=A0AAN7W120_9SACH|nr:hypothetical protein RI543_002974 [Kazachstania heterogenica]